MIAHHPSHQAAVNHHARTLSLPPVILIADDDRNVRMLLKAALEFDGCRVLSAVNGSEAFALAQTSMPDVMVTDVRMPGLDGFALIEAVRRLYPGLPVIIASADVSYGGRPLTEVAAGYGVTAVLAKPFDLPDLYQAVRHAIPGSSATVSGPSRDRSTSDGTPLEPIRRPVASRAMGSRTAGQPVGPI